MPAPSVTDQPVAAKPVDAKPVTAMTTADVLLLRERLDDLVRGRVDLVPAGDPVVIMVAERLAEARAADQKRIAALEQAVATARTQSTAVAEGLRNSLAAAVAATDATLAELAAARADLARLAEQLQQSARLLARAEAQLAEQAVKPAADGSQPVGAEAFADLMDKFVSSLGDRLGSLSLAGGEIFLKTAVAATSTGGARFVLPSATGPAPAVLHELRLRLDPKS